MYEKKNGQLIWTCDKCNTSNLPGLTQVRVGQILIMEICEQCAKSEIEEIRNHRSPESVAWYNEFIFNKNPTPSA